MRGKLAHPGWEWHGDTVHDENPIPALTVYFHAALAALSHFGASSHGDPSRPAISATFNPAHSSACRHPGRWACADPAAQSRNCAVITEEQHAQTEKETEPEECRAERHRNRPACTCPAACARAIPDRACQRA